VGEPGRGSWNLPPTKVWDDILDAGEWVTAIDVLGTFDALQAWGVALRDFLKTKASHEHPRIAGMVHLYDLRTLEPPTDSHRQRPPGSGRTMDVWLLRVPGPDQR
jgi:hypothetical protein